MIGASLVSNILQKGDLTILIEGLHIFRYKAPKILETKTIAEANITELTDCNVITIDKKGRVINLPSPTTSIGKDNTLIMIGNIEQEQKFRALFVDNKNNGFN